MKFDQRDRIRYIEINLFDNSYDAEMKIEIDVVIKNLIRAQSQKFGEVGVEEIFSLFIFSFSFCLHVII